MPVTEFECAIAKSQIGRYIAGDNLGGEVVRQLESHIAACPKCKMLLEERRKTLVAMLDGETPVAAAIRDTRPSLTQLPVEEEKPTLMDRLQSNRPKVEKDPSVVEVPAVAAAFAHSELNPEIQMVRLQPESGVLEQRPARTSVLSKLALFKSVPKENAPAISVDTLKEAKSAYQENNPTVRKPLVYGATLAVVVGAMSFVVKDPTQLLGPKLMTPAESKTSTSTAKAINTKKAKSNTVKASGISAQKFATEAPVVKKAEPKKEPKQQIKAQTFAQLDAELKPKNIKVTPTAKKVVKKSAKKIVKKKKVVDQPQNGVVRVYGADGAPIK